jgi:hypothetical protein
MTEMVARALAGMVAMVLARILPGVLAAFDGKSGAAGWRHDGMPAFASAVSRLAHPANSQGAGFPAPSEY